VPFCLLIALWLLMSSGQQDGKILVALGFAAVLQLMALTFYLMRGPR
jgi:mannose/fructose/N-acetylgalactosamine-specific phosphotransferase system component IIC